MDKIIDDNINIKVYSEDKLKVRQVCKKDKTTLSDVIRNFISQIVEKDTTKFINSESNESENLKMILDNIKTDNNKIVDLLKSQLEEKDKQLDQKNKLIENMQVLMKDNQQLLKDTQKNLLFLEENKIKDSQNKTSWFPFFKNKNV